MTSQQQFRNIVFLGTFIVIFWGCVFGRSAAVGLNAAFISTVLQRSAAASRLSEAVHAHTGWYSLWMGEIWRGSVCDGRARANHACFLMKQKQKHGVVYYSAPLAESGPLPAQIQNRSADQSCQVRRQQKHSKTATLLFTRGSKLHQKKWTIRTQLWARGQTLNATSQENKINNLINLWAQI